MKPERVVLLFGCCLAFGFAVWESWISATVVGTNVRLVWAGGLFLLGRIFGLFNQQLKDLK